MPKPPRWPRSAPPQPPINLNAPALRRRLAKASAPSYSWDDWARILGEQELRDYQRAGRDADFAALYNLDAHVKEQDRLSRLADQQRFLDAAADRRQAVVNAGLGAAVGTSGFGLGTGIDAVGLNPMTHEFLPQFDQYGPPSSPRRYPIPPLSDGDPSVWSPQKIDLPIPSAQQSMDAIESELRGEPWRDGSGSVYTPPSGYPEPSPASDALALDDYLGAARNIDLMLDEGGPVFQKPVITDNYDAVANDIAMELEDGFPHMVPTNDEPHMLHTYDEEAGLTGPPIVGFDADAMSDYRRHYVAQPSSMKADADSNRLAEIRARLLAAGADAALVNNLRSVSDLALRTNKGLALYLKEHARGDAPDYITGLPSGGVR